jgi:hypothetical protein
MVSRIKRPLPPEEINGFTYRDHPVTHNNFVTEMELLSISASKVARSILEELGTSCQGSQENSDGEVHGGENPHETIEDVREVLEIGDNLSRICWGSNALNNRQYYIVDTGHGPVTIKPKRDSASHKASAERVQGFIDDWIIETGWYRRQAEVSNRLDRHGEVFDMLYFQDDGILQLAFAKPMDLEDDADSKYLFVEDSELEFTDDLGVRRTNDLRYKPTAYYIDGNWYDDLPFNTPMKYLATIPKETQTLIQHRKRNVLSDDSRGLSLYWPVREELTWAKRLLANLMRVSTFQASYGMIRTVNEMFGVDATKSYLNSQQTGKLGSSPEKFDHPAPAVVTKPSSISYEFPETGAGISNHIETLVNLLRASASGMRLPEFMLTANVSEGNFASTLVSEGPFHKGMKFEQGQMVEEDMRILQQALRFAASKSVDGISDEDINNVTIEVKLPRVQTRNRKEDFEVNKQMYYDRAISRKTYAASEDRDDDAEQAQIAAEIPTEHTAPLATQKIPTPPGPEGTPDTSPLKEKGVMAGEPVEDPLKE